MARQVSSVFFLLFCLSLSGQELSWRISLEAGIGAGWWVYDKGLTDTLPHIHRGYDRTHLSFLIPQSMSIGLEYRNLSLGIQAGRSKLEDTRMVSSDHRRGSYNKYSIAAEGLEDIPMHHLGGELGYKLVNRPGFTFVPTLILGGLWLEASHPEVQAFDQRFYRAGELRFIVKLYPKVDLLLFPRYTNILLMDRSNPYENSHHNIYGIGLHAGLSVTP